MSAASLDRARPGLQSAVPLLLVLAIWVAARPYFGIVGDARFYLLHALRVLEPGRYDQDLYFKYGSQDSFTVFTAGYAPLVAWIGPAGAHFVAADGGGALWLAALMALVWTVFPRRSERWLAIVGVILLRVAYGGDGIFAYAEPFATPRLFAEALVMAGLALGLRGRGVLAAAVLVVAAAIHPLAAACGAGVLLVRLGDRRVWIVIGVAAAGGALALAVAVGPFAHALARYDDAWFQVVLLRCSQAFIAEWCWWDFCQVGAVLAVLSFCLIRADERERRLIVAVLAVTLALLVVSLLGADLAHNVLITNLQVWRSLWLTTVIANAFLPVILLRGDVQGWPRALLITGAGASALGRFLGAMELVAPAMTIAGCAFAVAEARTGPRPILRVAAIAAMGIGVGFAGLLIFLRVGLDDTLISDVARALVAAGAGAGLVWSLRRGASLRLAATAGLLLLAAVTLADQRTAWNRYVFGPPADDGLDRFLAGAGHTYWEGDGGLELLWFRHGAPSYFSCVQGSEALFFRGTAMDYARRGAALSRLDTADFAPAASPQCIEKQNARALGPTDPAQLATVCRALPDLDTLVLGQPVVGVPTQSWRAPAWQAQAGSARTLKIDTFYRYSCRPFR